MNGQFWLRAVLCAAVSGLLAIGGLALAQSPAAPASTAANTASPSKPAKPVPGPSAPASTDDGATTPADDAADGPAAATGPAGTAPRKAAAATGSPQHFEPTEKVRPDFDVAFPVDI